MLARRAPGAMRQLVIHENVYASKGLAPIDCPNGRAGSKSLNGGR